MAQKSNNSKKVLENKKIFKTEEFVEKTNLLNYLKKFQGKKILYRPNPGNLGDKIINLATKMMFDELKLDYVEVSGDQKVKKNTIIYGGGGNLVEYYQHCKNFLEINKEDNEIIILPHTINGHEDFIKSFGPNITIFCRDYNSYNYLKKINQKIQVFVSDDLAFFIQKSPLIIPRKYSYPNTDRTLNCFRTDCEKKSTNYPKNNIDLSMVDPYNLNPVDKKDTIAINKLLNYLTEFTDVHTDRLHIAIMATFLGRKVFLYHNSYWKNKAVYDCSLKKFPNIQFCGEKPTFLANFLYPKQFYSKLFNDYLIYDFKIEGDNLLVFTKPYTWNPTFYEKLIFELNGQKLKLIEKVEGAFKPDHTSRELFTTLKYALPNNSETIKLKVNYLEDEKYFLLQQENYPKIKGCCLMTLFKNDFWILPSFYEYYSKLGVDSFIFYYNGDFYKKDAFFRKFTQNKDNVFFKEWNYRYKEFGMGYLLYHNAQLVALNNFLAISKNTCDSILLLDLDEYLYLKPKKFEEIKKDIASKGRSVTFFHNVWATFKDMENYSLEPEQRKDLILQMEQEYIINNKIPEFINKKIVHSKYYSNRFSTDQAKYIVNPKRCDHLRVHFPKLYKEFENELTFELQDPPLVDLFGPNLLFLHLLPIREKIAKKEQQENLELEINLPDFINKN